MYVCVYAYFFSFFVSFSFRVVMQQRSTGATIEFLCHLSATKLPFDVFKFNLKCKFYSNKLTRRVIGKIRILCNKFARSAKFKFVSAQQQLLMCRVVGNAAHSSII